MLLPSHCSSTTGQAGGFARHVCAESSPDAQGRTVSTRRPRRRAGRRSVRAIDCLVASLTHLAPPHGILVEGNSQLGQASIASTACDDAPSAASGARRSRSGGRHVPQRHAGALRPRQGVRTKVHCLYNGSFQRPALVCAKLQSFPPTGWSLTQKQRWVQSSSFDTLQSSWQLPGASALEHVRTSHAQGSSAAAAECGCVRAERCQRGRERPARSRRLRTVARGQKGAVSASERSASRRTQRRMRAPQSPTPMVVPQKTWSRARCRPPAVRG